MTDFSGMDIEAANALIVSNIRSLIDEVGSNPSRLAKRAKLGHTSIRDILSGQSGSPRYETLLKIAKAAGVDIRRITVGPEYLDADPSEAELLDLFAKLEPSEKAFLMNAARAQIGARGSSPTQSDEESQ